MFLSHPSVALLALAFSASTCHAQIVNDLSKISRLWGQISPYADNVEDFFGVNITALPDGCQVEQAHLLQRHAQRFPTGSLEDGTNDSRFSQKVNSFTAAYPSARFTGPLAFLNTYKNLLGSSYLTNEGAATEFQAGVTFWNRYGRLLYNASAGQVAYNPTFLNGTAMKKPVLRTTSQSRIENSQINWALGFFGPSFEYLPNPKLTNESQYFDVVIIPEGVTENNTLASYDSCFNDDLTIPGLIGDQMVFNFIPHYLTNTTKRMQSHAPSGFEFNANDTYAMQSLCAYESAYFGLGASSLCGLFTLDEWNGFEQTLDIEYYFDYAFGNPTGRAQGIGYLQELVARLQNQYITSSNSSVNYTIDNNAQEFPLNRPFYADFTHDDIIVSTLTAMSLDYFHQAPKLTQSPPDPNRRFILSNMTPFGARLVTEVIACKSPNPGPAVHAINKFQYYSTQFGYNASEATNRFVRLRLNNGILPLDTLRFGNCDRKDGMCPLSDFLDSQKNSYALSNYDFACFGDYNTTIKNWYSGRDFDGTINETLS